MLSLVDKNRKIHNFNDFLDSEIFRYFYWWDWKIQEIGSGGQPKNTVMCRYVTLVRRLFELENFLDFWVFDLEKWISEIFHFTKSESQKLSKNFQVRKFRIQKVRIFERFFRFWKFQRFLVFEHGKIYGFWFLGVLKLFALSLFRILKNSMLNPISN